jgi:hypothetical protein
MRQDVAGALLVLAEPLSTSLEALQRSPDEHDGRSQQTTWRLERVGIRSPGNRLTVGTEVRLPRCASRDRGSARLDWRIRRSRA